jgi:3-hydroxyisobutyrate dehydrogenase-like beta-hydroxyacid dehydrogenase
MSQCIVRGGGEVVGFDPNPDAVTAAQATPASSVAEVSARADVVLLSLPDSHVVEGVVDGDDGLIAHAREGQTIVDLSTSSPDSTRRIHLALAEKNAYFLDAGISGGAAAAEKGALTLMVGGESDVLERVRPILSHFATNIFYVGTSGAGHTTKILNNFLNAIALSATAEVMIAAKKSGLDLDVVLEVFNKSSGVNFATLNRFPKIIHGDYLKGGLTNTLMMKDVTLYSDLIARLQVAGLHASGPLAAFGLARQLGYADEISNTVVDAIGDVSGGVRLFDGEPL